jgi:Trk K+ transport system NAD-binding subunit
LDVADYASLLRLSGDYSVAEVQVQPQDWLADRKLEEIRLRDEGVDLLGITREDGTYIGIP